MRRDLARLHRNAVTCGLTPLQWRMATILLAVNGWESACAFIDDVSRAAANREERGDA